MKSNGVILIFQPILEIEVPTSYKHIILFVMVERFDRKYYIIYLLLSRGIQVQNIVMLSRVLPMNRYTSGNVVVLCEDTHVFQ